MESIGDYLNKMTSSSESRGKYEELINQVLQDEEVVAFIQAHKRTQYRSRRTQRCEFV